MEKHRGELTPESVEKTKNSTSELEFDLTCVCGARVTAIRGMNGHYFLITTPSQVQTSVTNQPKLNRK
jgi:hypothetical protein